MSRFVLAEIRGEAPNVEHAVTQELVGGGSRFLVEVPDDRADAVARELNGKVFLSRAEARERGVIESGGAPGPAGEGVSHHFAGDMGGDSTEEFSDLPAEGPAGAGGPGTFPPYTTKRSGAEDREEPDRAAHQRDSRRG